MPGAVRTTLQSFSVTEGSIEWHDVRQTQEDGIGVESVVNYTPAMIETKLRDALSRPVEDPAQVPDPNESSVAGALPALCPPEVGRKVLDTKCTKYLEFPLDLGFADLL